MMLTTPNGSRVPAFQWFPSSGKTKGRQLREHFALADELNIRGIELDEGEHTASFDDPMTGNVELYPGDWILFDKKRASVIGRLAFDLTMRVKLDYDPESPNIVEAEHEGNTFVIDHNNNVIDVYSSDNVRMPASVHPVFQMIAECELPDFETLRDEFEETNITRREQDQMDAAKQDLREAV